MKMNFSIFPSCFSIILPLQLLYLCISLLHLCNQMLSLWQQGFFVFMITHSRWLEVSHPLHTHNYK